MANCNVNITMNPELLQSARKEEAFNEFYTEVRRNFKLSDYRIGLYKPVTPPFQCYELQIVRL
jgi:hypothetical protein